GEFPVGKIIVSNYSNTTNSCPWTIPDDRTPAARVRVEDYNDPTVVYDESDADFRIQGYLGLNAPNGGEDWLAGDHHNISWDWGGTMSAVKLSYTADGTNYILINAAAPNGAGSSGTFTYDWLVPETLSHTCRVKVEDTADVTVFDVSDAVFRINGSISITSPVGGERWVTNETHPITWTDRGDIPFVDILYSKNNFGGDVHTVVTRAPNAGSYDWKIPDDRSTTVKVRVLNSDDPTIVATSGGNVHIDYYHIHWVVRNLLTLEELTGLGVSESTVITHPDGSKETVTGWLVDKNGSTMTSPIDHDTPYGQWTTIWSAVSYADAGQPFLCDRDQSFEVLMETSAVHIWRAEAEFTYDATGDNLKIVAWLERDGSVVPGADKIAIYLYDDSGNVIAYNTVCDPVFYNKDTDGDKKNDVCDPVPTLYSATIDPSGYFYVTLPEPTNLQAGVVYAALVDITNQKNAHFRTPTSFSITESKRLESTESAVNKLATVTMPAFQSSIQTTIETGIEQQKQAITDIMVGEGGDPEAIITSGGMVGMLQQSLTSFEQSTTTAIQTLQSGAETAVKAGQELEATAKKFSWGGVVSPDPALTGDMVTLSVQGQPGLMPLLSLYTWDNKPIYTSQMLTETRPGFYVFEFKADTRFNPGKAYTFVVTEQVTGGLVSGSGMVESMGITTVAGLAAAAPEAERAAKKALDAIKAVEAVLVSNDNINISMTLKNLKDSVDALPETLSKEGPNAALMSAINDISEQLKGIMGEEGLDFGELLDEKLGDASTLKQMRNKTDTISSIVDLLLQIMEARLGGVDAPIINTSLQSGSVKFRIVAINPSKTKVQRVQLKKYLPQEVRPKDVMDLGGLELEYDSEKSIYFVFRNLDLQPSEVRVFEVEVEDIWMIPDAQFAQIRQSIDATLAKFKGSALFDEAKQVTDTLYPLLDEMPKAQSDESISREQHIGVYRQNVLNVKRIRDQLAELEKRIQPSAGMPEALEKNKFKMNLPSKSTTWLIILVVIVFLGLFAGIFFFVWQGQVKASQDVIKETAKTSFPGAGKEPEKK
ncbi:MAG: hypothetical protein PHT59_05975, partial [Candidatus Omnitrophica bacterium]|nr:hypothetical protein [Candidatus Omnitrophota bacterium]